VLGADIRQGTSMRTAGYHRKKTYLCNPTDGLKAMAERWFTTTSQTLYSVYEDTLPVSMKGRPGPTFEGWDFTKRDRQERAGNQKGTNVESKLN